MCLFSYNDFFLKVIQLAGDIFDWRRKIGNFLKINLLWNKLGFIDI